VPMKIGSTDEPTGTTHVTKPAAQPSTTPQVVPWLRSGASLL